MYLSVKDLSLICIGQPNSRLALYSAILLFPMGKGRMIMSLLPLVRVMRCYEPLDSSTCFYRSSKKIWWV